MDESGITAEYEAFSITPMRVITGGSLYMWALQNQKDFNKERTITRPEVLRKAVKLIEDGRYPQNVMENLASEGEDYWKWLD